MLRALLLLSLAAACGGREAVEVTLPVVTDSARVTPAVTDLGYTVTLTAARAAIRDLELTIEGEEHEAIAYLQDYPHPGHSGGGEVTGELRGDFVVDFLVDGAAVGSATLLTGQYEGANFAFRAAGAVDGLEPSDPLLGHTIYLEASITRDTETWTATITLDLDEGTALVGAPFAHLVTETSTETISLQLATVDPFGDATVFDGIDFAALGTGALTIEPGQTAQNQLRRLFGAHDYYYLEAN